LSALSPAIAVVVPALDEADAIEATLDALLADAFDAVVVADGGSADATVALAEARGATVVRSRAGRGPQQNAGAAAAAAEVLFFLHADTLPPAGAAEAIRRALRDPAVVGGCFRLRFDRPGPWLDLYAACSAWESGLTTFGDQGFFMRRTAFEAVGGFPDQPFLEDVELRRRLRRLGRFVKLRSSVVTSARRFLTVGPVRQMARNAVVLTLYRAGLSAERLARLYPARRSKRHAIAADGSTERAHVRRELVD
jgi:rSAM/selenodomain-associated transferase 2